MDTRAFDVVVVGELNIDLILNQLHQFPQIGKEILADQMTFTLGSSSAIFASNLRMLGSRVSFVGKLGNDMFGSHILSELKRRDLHTEDLIFSEQSHTGITVALNDGESRAMVTYPGAMNDLHVEEISEQALKKGGHLHVSSLFLQKALKKDITRLFEKARSLGMTTSLDPQWDPEEKWDIDWGELLPYVDLFLPNAEEAKSIQQTDDLVEAGQQLLVYAPAVVIKDGSNGAHLLRHNQHLHQKAFLSPHVEDAIGAGDSFDAGVIHKFIHRHSWQEALEFGALTGAVNTTRAGGTGAFQSQRLFREIAEQQFHFPLGDF